MTGERLDGWKAIASYLNRSVRQCQRLAESRGLPVRHFPGTRSVFAYREELDRWLMGVAGEQESPSSIELSRSGRHVVVPVDSMQAGAGSNPAENDASTEAAGARRRWASPVLMLIMGATVLGVLAVGLFAMAQFLQRETPWYEGGMALTGVWTFSGSSLSTQSAAVARFDTGHLAAPGTIAEVTLVSYGTRWSGGLEIFDDDLHWTFISISPREHQILVQRFPVGTVTAYPVGPLVAPARPVHLRLALTDGRLDITCNGQSAGRLSLAPWDVVSGKLLLRVGTPGDELHEPAGGACTFRHLRVQGEPAELPPRGVHEVPAQERPQADYVLTVTDIDDQVDVLIDGCRLASARYRETIGPMSITRFLTRGSHTIVANVFNRKWTASYSVTLTRDGVRIWHEACGSVTKPPYGCEALGQRLGMVKQLRYTFTAQ